MIIIQGRELNFSDFEGSMFQIGLCLDTYKLFSFKLDMMIDMTKLYILLPVWMTLTLTQVGSEKAWSCAIILLKSGMKKPKHSQCRNWLIM